jgi:orotidine-5'-phosphate decarboxylase
MLQLGTSESSAECSALHLLVGNDMVLVTPGIRPAGSEHADQKRMVTPVSAIAAGADYLVAGRPITAAPDPPAIAAAIISDIDKASG